MIDMVSRGDLTIVMAAILAISLSIAVDVNATSSSEISIKVGGYLVRIYEGADEGPASPSIIIAITLNGEHISVERVDVLEGSGLPTIVLDNRVVGDDPTYLEPLLRGVSSLSEGGCAGSLVASAVLRLSYERPYYLFFVSCGGRVFKLLSLGDELIVEGSDERELEDVLNFLQKLESLGGSPASSPVRTLATANYKGGEGSSALVTSEGGAAVAGGAKISGSGGTLISEEVVAAILLPAAVGLVSYFLIRKLLA